MSLKGCLTLAVQAGRMDQARADEILESARGFAGEAIDSAQKALDLEYTESALKRKQAALQALKKVEAITHQAQHPLGKSTGLNSLLSRDMTGGASWENVDYMSLGIAQNFWRRLVEPIDAMRTKAFGLTQDTKIAEATVRARFGESAGDAESQRFADALGEVFEDIRVQFNQAGGHILKRQNWFPQSHNQNFVGQAAKMLKSKLPDQDAWIQFVMPRLKRDLITDDMGRPLTDDQLKQALEETYDSIVTDGLNQIDALKRGQLKLANRHRDSRFLVFRDADAWLEYNRVFGNPDIFTTITDYVQSMSHEIALLNVMGPNPQDTFQTLFKLAQADIKSRGQAGLRENYTEALWNVVSGKVNTTSSPKFANFMQDVRNVTTSARLGTAMLSAVSDLAFMRQTAKWNSLNSSRLMGRYLRLLNPANKADRRAAAKAVGIVENWITRALAANRFTEVVGGNWSATMADVTMRSSGLSHHTNVGQQAIAMEVLATLAEHTGKTMDQLPEQFPLRRFMSAAEWDELRRTPLDADGFVSMDNLMARTDLSDVQKRTIARKTLSMTRDIANKGIPVPDARSRAITTGGAQRGSPMGEMVRTFAQFKGFPVSVIMQHVYAGLSQASMAGKARYMGELVVATTLMGALALQLKQIAEGKDPLSTDDPQFWVRAFAQGGGAGIYGDFVQAGLFGSNRFGQNLLVTMLGPSAGAINDLVGLTLGNVGEAIEGEEQNFGADLAFVLDRYTPVASSLWYAKLAYERWVTDQLALATDPKAREKMRRRERRMQREQGQEYWWRPGRTEPERPPEVL